MWWTMRKEGSFLRGPDEMGEWVLRGLTTHCMDVVFARRELGNHSGVLKADTLSTTVRKHRLQRINGRGKNRVGESSWRLVK